MDKYLICRKIKNSHVEQTYYGINIDLFLKIIYNYIVEYIINRVFWGRHYAERDETMREDKLTTNAISIISVDEIRAILSDLHIGKKPLAKLLGWGETTIIRYIEGDIPTTEYSNKLRTISDEPAYFYDLLLKNKDNLTRVAFRKSKKAVLEKLMESKISLIAQYMIYINEGDVCPSYIQWLLYYAQAFSLVLYDKELFEEEYSVNQCNMPYIKLYNSMRNHEISVLEVPRDRLTEEELNLINKVVESFSWYGPKALKALIALERTNFRISRDMESNRIIAKETIKNYFKEILVKYNIHKLEEINNYPDIKILELKNS